AMPVLKKYYLKYSEVAGKTVQYIFYDLFKDYQELKAEVLASSCFINDGKGNFTRVDLPRELQLAPIFSFASVDHAGIKTWLAAGNFYNVVPFEGRYDALQPSFFSYDKTGSKFQYNSELASPSGQARDAKWINYAGGNKVLIIARNNEPLIFLKPTNNN
ncbi:MAG TPA: hypothetical protein VFI06_12925, partial [Chitinophagaceae bacterium]|nr:hypothetical protein [Chitinophagaceae bacterium]